MPAARQYCLCFYLHHAMLAVGHQLCLTQAKLVQHACHMAANQRVVFVNPYREMTSWGVWWDSSFLNHRVDQIFLVDFFEHCQCVHLATWSVFIRNINRFQKGHPNWSGLPTYSPKTALSPVCVMTPATQWNLNHLSPKVLKDCGTLFWARSQSWYLLLRLMPRVCFTIQGLSNHHVLGHEAWVWHAYFKASSSSYSTCIFVHVP